MTEKRFRLVFRGVRGSISHPSPLLARYGAHTSCAEIPLGEGRWLILDAGTGLLATAARTSATAGKASGNREGSEPRTREFYFLLSHYHRDHIEALPFFDPLYDSNCRLVFHGRPQEGVTVRQALEQFVCPPWFPVPIGDAPSEKLYVDLGSEAIQIGALRIVTAVLRHRPSVTAFRIEHSEGALVFATDTESGDPDSDAELIALARGANVLIYDAHFLPEELETARGRGHSAWPQAVQAARESGVARLILFHHHPFRTDEEIEAAVVRARAEFPCVDAAYEGMEVDF